jgi:hypothetical protein
MTMGAYVVDMRNRMERAEAAAENEAIVSRDLRRALQLAVRMLAPYEPGDSRAVSDEFVALAAVADANDMSPRVMLVIEAALARDNS